MYIRRPLSLSPARQRLRSRKVKSAKQDLETDAEGKTKTGGQRRANFFFFFFFFF
jgi:hypothetical protein